MICRTKWHEKLITCMVKHRPFMYNKTVKKTFEILRSEITFVMDLYYNADKPRPTNNIKSSFFLKVMNINKTYI